jgi:hypothetical protein
MYETPRTVTGASPFNAGVTEQCKSKTILTVATALPWLKNRVPVESETEVRVPVVCAKS